MQNRIFTKELVDNASSLVVLAETNWCYPCKLMAKQINELVPEFPELEFLRIDLDQNYLFSREYKIIAVPTILFFRDGQLKSRLNNYKTKNVTYMWLKKNFSEKCQNNLIIN